MRALLRTTISPLLFGGSAILEAAPVFQEKGGIVAIEAESTASSLGDWKKKTDVKDYSGDCHLEFTGKRYDIPVATLSEADQEFISDWQP